VRLSTIVSVSRRAAEGVSPPETEADLVGFIP
jgi:hypothetical protein